MARTGAVDIDDVSPQLLDEIEHFFRVYKQLEPDDPTGHIHHTIETETDRMNLELDDSQSEVLREVLDSAYRDLRYEIADTDNTTYKEGLRSREALLSSILDKLGGPLPDRT